MKTVVEQSQINNLQYFSLYLNCQNNHYKVDLLGTSTFQPMPYSSWIKNNTQQKPVKLKLCKKDTFPLTKKDNLIDNVNSSGPPNADSKFTINYVFNLHDPLVTVTFSKLEIENIFLAKTEKKTLELLQKHQNLDPVFRRLKSWHKYKTKPLKGNTTIPRNKTLLRSFRKFNNTSIIEDTDILEYQTSDKKVPGLPLSMMITAFHTSHSLHTKGHSGAEKAYSNFTQNFYFPNAPIG